MHGLLMYTIRYSSVTRPQQIHVRVLTTEKAANRLLAEIDNDSTLTLLSAEGWDD